MVGHHHQIAAEELVGLPRERLGDAVSEEADAGQTGDGNHQRNQEQAKFAGTQIAAQHA